MASAFPTGNLAYLGEIDGNGYVLIVSLIDVMMSGEVITATVAKNKKAEDAAWMAANLDKIGSLTAQDGSNFLVSVSPCGTKLFQLTLNGGVALGQPYLPVGLIQDKVMMVKNGQGQSHTRFVAQIKHRHWLFVSLG